MSFKSWPFGRYPRAIRRLLDLGPTISTLAVMERVLAVRQIVGFDDLRKWGLLFWVRLCPDRCRERLDVHEFIMPVRL